MQLALEASGSREHQAKLSSKAYQDAKKKARESTLEPGTLVLSREPKKKRGLTAVWQGPYPVKEQRGLATYLLDVGHGRTRRRHRNALKVYEPEEVNVCSLVTAMADEEAQDGVDLENFMDPAPPDKTVTNCETELKHLTGEKREQLQKLLAEYQAVFNDVPGPANFPPYHLDTGQSKPVSQAPYRQGLGWKGKVEGAVKKLLDAGFVRPSQSPWSSPVIPVPKPDGSIHLVVDYRAINRLTPTDRYPLPRLDDLLSQVG